MVVLSVLGPIQPESIDQSRIYLDEWLLSDQTSRFRARDPAAEAGKTGSITLANVQAVRESPSGFLLENLVLGAAPCWEELHASLSATGGSSKPFVLVTTPARFRVPDFLQTLQTWAGTSGVGAHFGFGADVVAAVAQAARESSARIAWVQNTAAQLEADISHGLSKAALDEAEAVGLGGSAKRAKIDNSATSGSTTGAVSVSDAAVATFRPTALYVSVEAAIAEAERGTAGSAMDSEVLFHAALSTAFRVSCATGIAVLVSFAGVPASPPGQADRYLIALRAAAEENAAEEETGRTSGSGAGKRPSVCFLDFPTTGDHHDLIEGPGVLLSYSFARVLCDDSVPTGTYRDRKTFYKRWEAGGAHITPGLRFRTHLRAFGGLGLRPAAAVPHLTAEHLQIEAEAPDADQGPGKSSPAANAVNRDGWNLSTLLHEDTGTSISARLLKRWLSFDWEAPPDVAPIQETATCDFCGKTGIAIDRAFEKFKFKYCSPKCLREHGKTGAWD